jgi:hypothetical protein
MGGFMRRLTILVLLLLAAVAAAANQAANKTEAAQASGRVRTGINQARTAIERKDWALAREAIDRSRRSLGVGMSLLEADEYRRLSTLIDEAAEDVRVLTDSSIPEATRLKYYEATLRLRKRQATSRPALSPANIATAGSQSIPELTSALGRFVDGANEAMTVPERRDVKLDACFERILNRPIRLASKGLTKNNLYNFS